MTDMVNKPTHYQGEIECIDYIQDRLTEEQFKGYLAGATMKYLHRWQYKGNPEQDLRKANWYLDRLANVVGGSHEFSELVQEVDKEGYDFLDGNGPVPAHQHPNGGGWVADTATVDEGVYIGPNTKVFGNASVSDGVEVSDNAQIFGNAQVSGDAWISDNAQIFGNAQVSGDAWISANAQVFGNAQVSGRAWIFGNARVSGNAQVFGNAQVSGRAWIFGNARVSGDAWVSGNDKVSGKTEVFVDIGLIT